MASTKKIGSYNGVNNLHYSPTNFDIEPSLPRYELINPGVIELKVPDDKVNLGDTKDYQLSSLISAGINPESLSVNTTSNSRISNIDQIL